MRPKLTIYLTREGTKYSVDMPIESPVRLQRKIYDIAEAIGEAADKVEAKPRRTFGVITVRFTYNRHNVYTMNCDYEISKMASVADGKTTLALYESLVEVFSENAV